MAGVLALAGGATPLWRTVRVPCSHIASRASHAARRGDGSTARSYRAVHGVSGAGGVTSRAQASAGQRGRQLCTRAGGVAGSKRDAGAAVPIPPLDPRPPKQSLIVKALNSRAYAAFVALCGTGAVGYLYWRHRSKVVAEETMRAVTAAVRTARADCASKLAAVASPEGGQDATPSSGATPGDGGSCAAHSRVLHIPLHRGQAVVTQVELARPGAGAAGAAGAASHAPTVVLLCEPGDDGDYWGGVVDELRKAVFQPGSEVAAVRVVTVHTTRNPQQLRPLLLRADDVATVVKAVASAGPLVLVSDRTSVWHAMRAAATDAKGQVALVAVQPQCAALPAALDWWWQALYGEVPEARQPPKPDTSGSHINDQGDAGIDVDASLGRRQVPSFVTEPMANMHARRKLRVADWCWSPVLSALELQLVFTGVAPRLDALTVAAVVPEDAAFPLPIMWDFGQKSNFLSFWGSGLKLLNGMLTHDAAKVGSAGTGSFPVPQPGELDSGAPIAPRLTVHRVPGHNLVSLPLQAPGAVSRAVLDAVCKASAGDDDGTAAGNDGDATDAAPQAQSAA